MKKLNSGLSLRHLVAFAVLTLGAAFTTACVVEEPVIEPEESSAVSDDVELKPQPAPCCQMVGYVQCPDDGEEWVYFSVGACGQLKGAALTNCNNNCVAACVNLGYFNECYP